MAQGLRVTNDNGQVLIDSDLFHYHFAGKATVASSFVNPTLTNKSGTTAHSSQEAGKVFIFTFASNGAKPPMCFIKPISTGGSAPFAGIVLTERNGANWDIWVLQTGSSSAAPELYCFSPIDQLSGYSSDTHGMQTFNGSGDITFDSRALPLRIVGGGDIKPSSMPHSGSVGSGTTPSLAPNNTTDYASGVSGTTDLMYYCPSLASGCQEYKYEQQTSHCSGFDVYGTCIGREDVWARGDLWWSFYRSAFRLNASGYLQSGWVTYVNGHVWDEDSDSSWAGLLIVLGGWAFGIGGLIGGLVVGGLLSGSASVAGGYHPYENSSRNTGVLNGFIMSRPSYYD